MRRMTEEEMAWFRFNYAKGKCEWCGAALDWDRRGRQYAGEEGCWELHHHPHKSRLDEAFGGEEIRDEIYPDIPLNFRVLCWDCHKHPHGRNRPLDWRDPFR